MKENHINKVNGVTHKIRKIRKKNNNNNEGKEKEEIKFCYQHITLSTFRHFFLFNRVTIFFKYNIIYIRPLNL